MLEPDKNQLSHSLQNTPFRSNGGGRHIQLGPPPTTHRHKPTLSRKQDTRRRHRPARSPPRTHPLTHALAAITSPRPPGAWCRKKSYTHWSGNAASRSRRVASPRASRIARRAARDMPTNGSRWSQCRAIAITKVRPNSRRMVPTKHARASDLGIQYYS